MPYRPTRNQEASIIDYLKDCFEEDWSGINVEKSFSRVYDQTLPVICVRLGLVSHSSVEIGTDSIYRSSQLLIDIFAKNDGQKLDLVDYIVSKIKSGFDYYEYVIENGITKSKTKSGRIIVNKPIEVTHINFSDDKDTLDEHDKYRSLITAEIRIGKVE